MAVAGLTVIYGCLLATVIGLAAWVYMSMNAKTGRSLVVFEDVATME